MAKIQHPSSLNPWQQYRQACSIFRNTSRASNSAWYQQALDLDLQLHIRPDGTGVFAAYYDRKKSNWTPGPQLSDEMLRDESEHESITKQILDFANTSRAKSIGVILHIADEFATTELKPEIDNPNALPDLRSTAIENPTEILEDTSVDASKFSWRVIPYAAAGSEAIGTTITISREYAPLMAALRSAGEQANFPIITQSLSAPLVALTGLPSMLQSQPEKPFVTILQYPWFTVMAFFNEYADLKLIRTLQHRGLRQASNFRNALFTTSASLEFMDPDLYVVPLGQEIDEGLADSLKPHFSNSKVETLIPPQADGVPSYCSEPLIANLGSNDGQSITSHTLTTFRDDKWSLQDFLPSPSEVLETYPTKSEMRLLKGALLARIILVVLTIGGLGYFGLGVANLMRMPEWSMEPGQANLAEMKLAKLRTERLRIDHWNNLLADRSKAWVVMEAVARMIPEKSNVLLKGVSYTARPDSTPGQNTAGFVKSWKITGFARDEALNYLNMLNTRDGINKLFNEVAQITGSDAYATDIGNRNISVNIRTRENNTFRQVHYEEMTLTDETTYPFTFDLTITQRFEATDPLAITVPTAP